MSLPRQKHQHLLVGEVRSLWLRGALRHVTGWEDPELPPTSFRRKAPVQRLFGFFAGPGASGSLNKRRAQRDPKELGTAS